jgi:hypothetical protein
VYFSKSSKLTLVPRVFKYAFMNGTTKK